MALNKIDNIGGGVKLVDINPNQTEANIFKLIIGKSSSGGTIYAQSIPVKGYKKISYVTNSSYAYADVSYYDINGNVLSTDTHVCPYTGWTQYVDIPTDCVSIIFSPSGTNNDLGFPYWYSLLV